MSIAGKKTNQALLILFEIFRLKKRRRFKIRITHIYDIENILKQIIWIQIICQKNRILNCIIYQIVIDFEHKIFKKTMKYIT